MTRLREVAGDRVAVDLDGARWRTLPAGVVVRAGLRDGLELDRERLRLLAREVRRAAAVEAAARLLRSRDRSRAELREQLRRRGLAAGPIEAALERLGDAGLVRDEEVARRRAAELAARGQGDAAIVDDLTRRGLDRDVVAEAVAELEPEAKRAHRLVAARGRSMATARLLARKGFEDDSVEAALAGLVANGSLDG